ANLVFGWFTLPETVTDETRRSFEPGRANPLGALRSVGRLSGVAPLLAIIFLTELAFISYVAVWAFWGKAAFGWSTTETGLSLAAFGLGAIVVQAWGVRLYLRVLGERGTILFSFAYSFVWFILFALLPPTQFGGWLAIFFCPLSALGEVMWPVLQGRVSRLAPADMQGEALGVVASMRSAAQVAGPLVMTAMFAWGAAFPVPFYGAPYLLGAALIALCLILFRRSPEPAPATP
ncbi:MAG TPA: MFS transporter, partial [Rubellimicrobium sp.]|nr:MFS transporter [Rubellimicrobium sp.]